MEKLIGSCLCGSRAGIKSIIVVKEMNKEGTKIIGWCNGI
jgi:hypothetical protein